MSVRLHNVTKKVRLGPVRLTYENLNIDVPDGGRVALLGHKDAGLPAIVNLMCAADAPDAGYVERTQSISWSIPSSSYIAKHLTLAANARFVARLYETDENAYCARLQELGQFGDAFNTVVDQCQNEHRSMFCFLAGICLPFDHYVLTNVNIGKKGDRERTAAMVQELSERASIVLVGQDVKNAKILCDRAYVFQDGKATFYDDMEAAGEHFASVDASNVDEDDDDFMGGDSALQDLVNMDF
jgi:capsular polysaccharide transport system ATP-binding protein